MVYKSTILEMKSSSSSGFIQIKEFGKIAIQSIGKGTGTGSIEVSNNSIDWVENDPSTTNIDLTIPIILDSFPWVFIRFVSNGTGSDTLEFLISAKQ